MGNITFLEVEGINCSLFAYIDGDNKVIHGFVNGSIQIFSLMDGFVSFSGVLHDRVTIPKKHSTTITCMRMHESWLISGDAKGLLVAFDTFSRKLCGFTHHHFAPIISIVCVSEKLLLVVDASGRCSLCTLTEELAFKAFLGTRNTPICSLKWTNPDPLRICLCFRDNYLQIWNLATGRGEDYDLRTLESGEELFRPFIHHEVIACPRKPANQVLYEIDHPILRSSLALRPNLAKQDPFQVASLDVRRLIEIIKFYAGNPMSCEQKAQLLETLSLLLSLLLPWMKRFHYSIQDKVHYQLHF